MIHKTSEKRLVLLITALTIFQVVCSQEVKVGLFRNVQLRTVVFKVLEGEYSVKNKDSLALILKPSDILFVTSIGDRVSIWNSANHLGMHSEIFITGSQTSRMSVEPVFPYITARNYFGDFRLLVDTAMRLTLINVVPIHEYIVGVVEAESGVKAHPEFYKAQAIICRTYLLNHLQRHKDEGFSVCDEVHCQVYKGYGIQHEPILKAVQETNGYVIVDQQGMLITAAFHANSGGETVNSENVWSTYLPYLRGKQDPYYDKLSHSSWEKRISAEEWKNFLQTYNIPWDVNIKFEYQQPKRERFMIINNQPLLLTEIRSYFGLKSTFFSIIQKDREVIFKGRGYGHGVGMSQESAMKMAQKGMSFAEIINFFYSDVRIVDIFQTTYLQNMIFENQ
ncbi:MAG TPA: SpoIID/LytB domain-containing protein [Salinivirgaceae bacterium]|nr:SpoIID/LytB domain-containing protein [Salinivirgaceae bacterium]